MTKPADNALPGLDLDAVRHPMWAKPTEDDEPVHITALHIAVWSSMLPFDGRPYSEGIVWFAEQVWFLSTAHEPYWLVGQVIRVRQEALKRAYVADHNEWAPVIVRLANAYVDAIVGAA